MVLSFVEEGIEKWLVIPYLQRIADVGTVHGVWGCEVTVYNLSFFIRFCFPFELVLLVLLNVSSYADLIEASSLPEEVKAEDRQHDKREGNEQRND